MTNLLMLLYDLDTAQAQAMSGFAWWFVSFAVTCIGFGIIQSFGNDGDKGKKDDKD